MKIPYLMVTGMAATLLAAPAGFQEKASAPTQDQIAASSKKINDLQKERISTLKELVEQLKVRFQSGRGGSDEIYEARVQLHDAEMAVAEKGVDRMALQQKIIEVLREYEQVAEGQHASGRGASSSVLKVKARRLQAEIDLEQTKVKEARENKEKAKKPKSETD